MTAFRELREQVRKRIALVGRVVAEVISDPDVKITVTRTEHVQCSCRVQMRIALSCDFDVPDEMPEEALRKLAPLAYRKLAIYARSHFFDHIGTDPNLRSSV